MHSNDRNDLCRFADTPWWIIPIVWSPISLTFLYLSVMSIYSGAEIHHLGTCASGPIHTGRARANFNANPLMLLACSVDTPIHINRSYLLCVALRRVSCGLVLRKAQEVERTCLLQPGWPCGVMYVSSSSCRTPLDLPPPP